MSSPSGRSKNNSRSSRREMDYKESEVSQTKRVQKAVREARKSSREKGRQSRKMNQPPRTPTGLVIKTSPERKGTSQYLGMNSPSMSEIHMDQLLAPTYDSQNGTSIGASSVNTSDDIIRKVEMEIATARKAATEAQSRLADALSKSWELQHKYSNMSETNDHDSLDDLDIPLRDILSMSSGEQDSPKFGQSPVKAREEVPDMALDDSEQPSEQNGNEQDGAGALEKIESAVSAESDEGSQTGKTDSTDPTDSPTGSSHGSSTASPVLRYTGTQQTFESGVELGLEDVEATLGNGANMDVVASNSDDESERGEYASTSPRSETLPDEYSDYTEETVSDGDGDDDSHSEYTEETVNSDEEEEKEEADEEEEKEEEELPVDRVPEPAGHSQGHDAENKPDERNNEVPDAGSPKPWIVGSRDMHKSPKEVKPWWTGGWWPDDDKGKKGEGPQSTERPPAKGAEPNDVQEANTKASQKEALSIPAFSDGTDHVPIESRAKAEETKEAPASPWSTTPGSEHEDPTNADTKDEKKIDDHIKQEGRVDSPVTETPVLGNLTVNTDVVEPVDETDAAKPEAKVAETPVKFRQPYPVPPQVPKPRPAPDIIADHTTGAPRRVTRWSKPKPELKDLLAAVKGASLARRSNAVGALKILLSREAKNQIILVRTTGFLEALVFACSEDIEASPEMETAVIARTRAVTTIMKVSEPKENRVLIITEPGLPECLVKVVKEDTGEGRAHACAALAMLAKTPKNKELLVNVDDLVNVLSLVVNGTIDPTMGPASTQEVHNGGGSAFSFEDDATDVSSVHQESLGVDLYSSDSIRKQKDEKQSEFELQAKINACAVLMHLSKHCSISSTLAANYTFMNSMMAVSRDFDSPLNTKCLEIVCNITRFHANTAEMARNDVLLETLLKCGKSRSVDDRVWALRSFQNIAGESSSKVILANGKILTLLSICAMRMGDEQEAAVATIYNLSTEPSAVVPITNTRNVVATLVHLSHNPKVSNKVQGMSCEALATIGLWLQTLAGTGTVPEGMPKSLLPTHRTVGWQRWA